MSDPDREVARAESTVSDPHPLYREEALLALEGKRDEGALLRVSPGWINRLYWTLLGSFLLALVYSFVASVNEYAEGPAVVRMTGHSQLTALTAGTVDKVLVLPGQRVEEGQVLVQFHAGRERSELERVQVEFDLHLVQLLRNPGDDAARRSLAAMRPQKALAEARLAERTLCAAHAGVVSDVRIRPGQLLAAGEPVISLVPPGSELSLLAFLPGRYRPLLEEGMDLRLEITGYAHAYQTLVVSEVGDEVIGPSAVRRFLGVEMGDAIPIGQAVVVVGAVLPEAGFRSSGHDYEFYPGMQGVAEVVIRKEALIETLVPGVKAVLEKIRG